MTNLIKFMLCGVYINYFESNFDIDFIISTVSTTINDISFYDRFFREIFEILSFINVLKLLFNKLYCIIMRLIIPIYNF
jgi:hypothetical protein